MVRLKFTVDGPLFALAVGASALLGCSAAPRSGSESTSAMAVNPAPENVSKTDPRLATTRHADFATRIGADCPSNGPSDAMCDGGNYDVELRDDCSAAGFFGGVSAKAGSALLNGLPPKDTAVVGKLAKGQLLCIRAIARAGQNPNWYYVTALPVAAIAGCEGNALCTTYGDRPIAWTQPARARATCTLRSMDRPDTGCASGWIDAEAVEAFSNGM